MSDRPRLHFVKRWSMRLLGSFILIMIITAVIQYSESLSAKSGLVGFLKTLDETDPGWQWQDLEAKRPILADRQNSMVYIRQMNENRLPNELQVHNYFYDDIAPNEQIDGLIREAMESCRDLRPLEFELVRGLKNLPQGRDHIEIRKNFFSTLLPNVQKSRRAGEYLTYEIELLLDQRQWDQAGEEIIGILNAGAALRDEPFLISQLIRIAMRAIARVRMERILAHGQLKPELLARLQQRFAEEAQENCMLTGLRGERAGLHMMFSAIASGELSTREFLASSGSGPGTALEQLGARALVSMPKVHYTLLETCTKAITIAQKPFHLQQAEIDLLQDEIKTRVGGKTLNINDRFAAMLIPAYANVFEAAIRDRNMMNATMLGLAAERFRIQEKRWPTDINELVPKYLAEVPLNTRTGDPLKIETHEDGIQINLTPIGISPSEKSKIQIFGLWNRNRRHQPGRIYQETDEVAGMGSAAGSAASSGDADMKEELPEPREWNGPIPKQLPSTTLRVTEN
jgi:hypothetical protein